MVAARADVQIHDVDSREEWRKAYDSLVPVLKFNDQPLCQHRLNRKAVHNALAEVAAEKSGHQA